MARKRRPKPKPPVLKPLKPGKPDPAPQPTPQPTPPGGSTLAPNPLVPQGDPPYAAPEGQAWDWQSGTGWVLIPAPELTPMPRPNPGRSPEGVMSCESVKGSAPEGFQWQGQITVDADGNRTDTCTLVRIEDDTSQRDADRRMAKEEFRSILEGMGFTVDFGFSQAEIDQLFSSVEGWISDGWADGYDGGEKMLMLFRTSDSTKSIYAKRFPGMKALAARGQAMSEIEYINLERSYRNVLSSANLPPQYYDSFDDYGRFIAGGVSAAEVEGRITAAQSAMNPLVARELQDYYGIGQDKALAFLLGMTDEKGLLLDAQSEARNQQTIRDINRNIQIGGMAEGAGFRMGLAESAALAGTSLGQTIDPFDVRTGAQLEGTFAQARRTANREVTLAGIDDEAYTEQDTLLAAFGNDEKRLASERRARRERSRFSGSSGASSASLSVQRNL